MTEIKCIMCGGEPICRAGCEHCHLGSPFHYCDILVKHIEDVTENSMLPTWPGTSFCIPALRQQRDKIKAAWGHLLACLDGDGGHAQTGVVAEDLERVVTKVYDRVLLQQEAEAKLEAAEKDVQRWRAMFEHAARLLADEIEMYGLAGDEATEEIERWVNFANSGKDGGR